MKNLTIGILFVIAFSVVFQLAQGVTNDGYRYGITGFAGLILAFGFTFLAREMRDRRGDR